MAVPAGYSVIDLDQKPFKIIRDQTAELTLYEPADVAVKDYSALSYTEAFDKMYEIIRKEYAFNGIDGQTAGLGRGLCGTGAQSGQRRRSARPLCLLPCAARPDDEIQ